MGQKVNPVGLRLGINRTWDSRWYAGKTSYGSLLHEDMEIRAALMKELKQAAVSKIVIERPHKKCRVSIQSARPGVVIGKKGADIEKLRRKVAELTDSDVVINIVEIRKPELDAQLVAESIAQQLERRVAFRRAMKRAVQSAMRLGAGGIRINCSGRLGGADLHVLVQQRAVASLAGIPPRIPGAVDAQAKPDRIDFLTHFRLRYACAASTSRTTMVRFENGLKIFPTRPRARGSCRFSTKPVPTRASTTTRSSTSRS